ncbi:RNA 2',3'-cyclic phosphodiesterase [Sphingomonas sp. Tas61C01]|uniref:RNA 2',3'-cyclic phosphodiesterase n=1 Tax=Sphingomonas sp. Tas61C01 TaxID=3458297 RepID=UPI00403E64C9
MIRLFVALRPPPPIRARLLAAMGDIGAARWQEDAQLHVTLRFIGAVERPVAEDVAAALAGLYADAPTASLAGVGRFAHRGRTDTLWAALAPHDALQALHRKVDHACVRAGLEPERRAYIPHVTLARMPRAAGAELEVERWLATNAGLASEPFALPHLVLYESILGRDGAVYEPVMRWQLGTRAAAPGS